MFNLTAGTGVSFSTGTTYNGSTAITINATGTGGTVTSVAALTLGTTGTDLSSTVANGTTTPVITLNVPTASATNRGALSAADWTTFNNKTSNTGTVTSVAASVPSFLSISGSPITTSGTLAISLSGTALPTTSGGTGLTSFTSGGVVYASSTSALTTGSALVFDGTNLGIGITPSAWFGNSRVIQISSGGALEGRSNYTPYVALASNKYVNSGGSDIYLSTNFAAQYIQDTGRHQWYTAPSGTAGNTITFTERMRLSDNGIVTMSVYGAGAATFSAAGVISSVSDETWKVKDGVPLNPDAMIQKLEPGYWFYNEEKKEIFGADRQLGFYAQNVNQAIGPEAAPIPEEGKPWGYYDRSVLAVTVMSLQKALATIENLTSRIKVLESK